MPWVETQSLSFAARHESTQADEAAAVLQSLEAFRAEMQELFEYTPGEVAVIIHPRPAALTLAQPWLPLARRVASPASRRYFAGWFSSEEIHVLAPPALESRASSVPGSREALLLSPRHEYAHLVLGVNNASLPPPFTTTTFRRYVRMAWLCEGAAVHFSGQGRHLRGAIARRMHEGRRPEFPPAARDALLLGGTIYSLLEREHGPEACVELATMPEEMGPRRAIDEVFGRPAASVARDWFEYLDALRMQAAPTRRRPANGQQ